MSDLQNNGVGELNDHTSRVKGALGNFIAQRFESFLDGVTDGQLALTWPGGTTTYHGARSDDISKNASVSLHNLQPIRRLATNGSIGFAESYMDGEWSTDSLLNLFHLFMRNEVNVNSSTTGSFRSRLGRFVRHWQNRNSKAGSERNIAYHYDLGNEFYKLWLDGSMTYSSAIYDSESESLANAQQNKMAKVCEMMAPDAGNRVLEVGCGWGGLAKYMATKAEVSVEGISLSKEQLQYASDNNSITADYDTDTSGGSTAFRYQDYREVDDEYDHIMSIEMFEAVGEQYWETYFQQLQRLLKSGGSAVLQVITIDESRYEKYRKQPDFIQRYIFPGGMLPTRSRLKELANNAGFDIDQSHWFGQSYAKTLADWRSVFEQEQRSILAQGFDERFLRMWRYYLVYCQTGFTFGTIDVGLLKLVKQN